MTLFTLVGKHAGCMHWRPGEEPNAGLGLGCGIWGLEEVLSSLLVEHWKMQVPFGSSTGHMGEQRLKACLPTAPPLPHFPLHLAASLPSTVIVDGSGQEVAGTGGYLREHA